MSIIFQMFCLMFCVLHIVFSVFPFFINQTNDIIEINFYMGDLKKRNQKTKKRTERGQETGKEN